MRQSSLVVVANRLPIDDSVAPDGACEWRRSPGGLVSALHPLLRHTPATWVGWAGGTGPAPALPDVDGVRMHAVPLTAEDLRDHYEGFANSTLWPLYHDAVEQPGYHRRWWEAYQRVNQRFAEAAARGGRARRGGLGAGLPPAARPRRCCARCAPTCGSASSCTCRSRRRSCSCSCRAGPSCCAACSAPT